MRSTAKGTLTASDLAALPRYREKSPYLIESAGERKWPIAALGAASISHYNSYMPPAVPYGRYGATS